MWWHWGSESCSWTWAGTVSPLGISSQCHCSSVSPRDALTVACIVACIVLDQNLLSSERHQKNNRIQEVQNLCWALNQSQWAQRALSHPQEGRQTRQGEDAIVLSPGVSQMRCQVSKDKCMPAGLMDVASHRKKRSTLGQAWILEVPGCGQIHVTNKGFKAFIQKMTNLPSSGHGAQWKACQSLRTITCFLRSHST